MWILHPAGHNQVDIAPNNMFERRIEVEIVMEDVRTFGLELHKKIDVAAARVKAVGERPATTPRSQAILVGVYEDIERNPADIELDQFYPSAPETVWQALTDPTTLSEWFLQSVGYATGIGSQFMFLIPSDPPAEIACEVIEATAPTQLTWNWRDMRMSTTVDWPVFWSVSPHGRGARLALVQRGFDLDDKPQKMARSGMERFFWRNALAQLGPVLKRST